jgi:hypothetical protein
MVNSSPTSNGFPKSSIAVMRSNGLNPAAAPANPQAPIVAQPVAVAPAAQAGAGKMKGGKKGMKIPAILLYANPFFTGKKNKTNRRKKHGSTKKHRK